MLILHSRKVIFLRCRKTASTSLEIALSQFAEEGDIVTPLCARDESLRLEKGGIAPQNYLDKDGAIRYFNHMKAAEVQELVGHRTWNAFYKFCVDRNR